MKAKGRKIGRGKKKNARMGYRDRAAKKLRIARMMRLFPRYRAPGWKKGSYGLVEDESTKQFAPGARRGSQAPS